MPSIVQQYLREIDNAVLFTLYDDGSMIWDNGIKVAIGAGSPEGVITAPPGSWYIRTNGVSPNLWYQKLTGTGSTGWSAMGTAAVVNPGGNDTDIQFNDGGALGGTDKFTWDNINFAFQDNGVANFVDDANLGNIGQGQINGVTIAADLEESAPDAFQGTSFLDVVSTRTEFETETDFYVGSSFGLQVIPSGNYVEPFGPIYAGMMIGLLVPAASTHKFSDAYGLLVACHNAGSGVMNDELAGVRGVCSKDSAAHDNALVGGDFEGNVVSGLVDQVYGVRALGTATGGTATNVYGLRVDNGAAGGTLTHNYGIWIQDMTSGAGNPDPWGIWVDGGKCYFKTAVLTSGVIGVGATSTPDTGFSRISAGIFGLGNGSAASVSGTLRLSHIRASALQIFANNAAAITGGLAAGDFYRTGADPDVVCVVH